MFFLGCQQPALGHLLKLVWRGSDSLQRAFHSISEVTWNVFLGVTTTCSRSLVEIGLKGAGMQIPLLCASLTESLQSQDQLLSSCRCHCCLAAAIICSLKPYEFHVSSMKCYDASCHFRMFVNFTPFVKFTILAWQSIRHWLGISRVYIYMMYNLISQSTKHEFH